MFVRRERARMRSGPRRIVDSYVDPISKRSPVSRWDIETFGFQRSRTVMSASASKTSSGRRVVSSEPANRIMTKRTSGARCRVSVVDNQSTARQRPPEQRSNEPRPGWAPVSLSVVGYLKPLASSHSEATSSDSRKAMSVSVFQARRSAVVMAALSSFRSSRSWSPYASSTSVLMMGAMF